MLENNLGQVNYLNLLHKIDFTTVSHKVVMAVGDETETDLANQMINLVVKPLKVKFVDRLVDHTDDLYVVGTNNKVSNFADNKDNFDDEITNNIVTVNDDIGIVDCDKPITSDFLLIDAVYEVDKDVNHSHIDRTTDETVDNLVDSGTNMTGDIPVDNSFDKFVNTSVDTGTRCMTSWRRRFGADNLARTTGRMISRRLQNSARDISVPYYWAPDYWAPITYHCELKQF